MKIKTYVCEACTYQRDEYFQDTETPPEYLQGELCPECGESLVKAFIPKDNPQRWYHRDPKQGSN